MIDCLTSRVQWPPSLASLLGTVCRLSGCAVALLAVRLALGRGPAGCAPIACLPRLPAHDLDGGPLTGGVPDWLRAGAVISLQTVLGDAGVWNNYTGEGQFRASTDVAAGAGDISASRAFQRGNQCSVVAPAQTTRGPDGIRAGHGLRGGGANGALPSIPPESAPQRGRIWPRCSGSSVQSALLMANSADQSSGGLPRSSILAKTTYGSDLLPAERNVSSSFTQA